MRIDKKDASGHNVTLVSRLSPHGEPMVSLYIAIQTGKRRPPLSTITVSREELRALAEGV